MRLGRRRWPAFHTSKRRIIPELAADIAKIKGARGGLINIYKLLLHSPTVHDDVVRAHRRDPLEDQAHAAAARDRHRSRGAGGEIRLRAATSTCRGIAVPDGVSLEECEALKDWRASKFFSEAERAALAYVDAMIAGPEVPDDVFNARAQALQRTRGGRTDRSGRHLPDAQPRVHRAAGRPRAEKELKAAAVPSLPVIVVEDDPFTRLIPLVLDPKASEERRAAFADFMSTDEPDFAGWCERVRQGSAGLYPAEVRMVTSEAEMRANLKDCVALVVESFRVGRDDLAAAPAAQGRAEIRHGLAQHRHRRLRRERHQAAHAAASRQHLLRRARLRADADAGAEARRARRPGHRRTHRGRPRRLPAVRAAATPPAATTPALGGTRALNGATIGIIGLGEIGREIAIRARAFDMNVLYHQRTRAPEAEERELKARHVPLPTLLSESDWIVPQLPTVPGTRDLLGRAELAQIKPGACIVNVANAAIINREALIEALARRPARRRGARRALSGAGARRRRTADVRQRHPDAAHGGIAALQRPQRFRTTHHRARPGACCNETRLHWLLLRAGAWPRRRSRKATQAIRTGRCVSSCRFRPAPPPTSSAA